jgi:hypothetical protein
VHAIIDSEILLQVCIEYSSYSGHIYLVFAIYREKQMVEECWRKLVEVTIVISMVTGLV